MEKSSVLETYTLSQLHIIGTKHYSLYKQGEKTNSNVIYTFDSIRTIQICKNCDCLIKIVPT